MVTIGTWNTQERVYNVILRETDKNHHDLLREKELVFQLKFENDPFHKMSPSTTHSKDSVGNSLYSITLSIEEFFKLKPYNIMEQKAEEKKDLIVGSAFLITKEDSINMVSINASLIRNAIEKLKDNEKGDIKVILLPNKNRREGKKDPDFIITKAFRSDQTIASLYLKKDVLLKEKGEKYIPVVVMHKKGENIKSDKAPNLVVFSKENKDEKNAVIGNGWKESESRAVAKDILAEKLDSEKKNESKSIKV